MLHPAVSQIQALIHAGDLGVAETRCREALAEAADDANLNAMMAFIGHHTGRPQLTVDAALKAVRQVENYPFALLLLADGLAALERHGEAISVLERAHALNPADQTIAERFVGQIVAAHGFERAAAGLSGRDVPPIVAAAFAWSAFEQGHDLAPAGYGVYRLSGISDWAQAVGAPIRWLGEAEATPFQPPPILDDRGYTPAGPVTMVGGNAPYVAELPDVTVLSKSSLLLTSDRHALNDPAGHPTFGKDVSFIWDKAHVARRGPHVLLRPGAYAVAELEAGAWLSGLAADAFGHWLPEFLPKLEALRAHPDFADLPIIVDEGMPQSHFDYLKSVVPNPVVTVPANGALRCRRLLVSPSPSFFPTELEPDHTIPPQEIGGLSPRAMTFLRDRALATNGGASSGRFGPRLFLSRRNMSWRKMANEAEIAAFLEAQGFQTILIEELTLAEQIEMFRGAEVIVAPNGSSLLNLIFAPTAVKLLVLSQKGVFNWGHFYGTMHQLGYEMTFVCGDEEADGKHADYTVPVERVAAALARTGA